ncbi:hypothetical protein OS125_04485 [Corynebacterium sp. P7003]|uniref:Carrier domain-containing protein n=1 Tax=Corynebacterium pygosceleis TaxID=2800406 RepID=A0ABT3WT64_9CORY|nr:hypothetical protein [Corynebacterium pygosceleis]MCX7444504.1 hypothetical protein [Corynebacterium pygosceleis]
MSVVSYGYIRPDEDCVLISGWNFSVDGKHVQDPESPPGWDYEIPVSCRVSLNIDMTRLLTGARLAESISDAEERGIGVSAVLRWESSRTGQRGASERQLIRNGENSLFLEVPGHLLGGQFAVTPVVVLEENSAPPSGSVSPVRPGSILWEGMKRILPIEGVGAQFPTAAVDFRKAGFDSSGALWFIELHENLDVPSQGGARIFLNTANKRTLRMLEDPDCPESQQLRAMMECEVLTHLLIHAAQRIDSGTAYEDPDPESFRETLHQLLNSFFPAEAPEQLREDIGRIAAVAQDRVLNQDRDK